MRDVAVPDKEKKPQIYGVDKITAAMRQLDTAVYLFLNRQDDPISPAVLSASAWSVVKDLLGNNGDSIHYQFGLGGCYSYSDLNTFWNFCKHADKDPNNELQFPRGFVENLLFSAIHDFRLLHELSQNMGEFYYPREEKLLS